MIERRSEPRRRVLKGGLISFGGAGVDCTVRNISPNGAALDVASIVGIPRSFQLAIETDHFLRRCRLVWNSDRRLGVVFE
ncbi:PilZ domain-containing protein [Bradyrhizobium sp. SYSU BS000235]|uniref:PilZ domain-containing protein n=1 Tax=Bradyrhizobium sp. SYSU BS000235 TaxID=3411332 RepID=UPI003C726E1D